MRCALMAGFLPHYESGLSHGDLGATTRIEPLSPAAGMALQMTTWCVPPMLLTGAVFLAPFADTKKPHYPGKVRQQWGSVQHTAGHEL